MLPHIPLFRLSSTTLHPHLPIFPFFTLPIISLSHPPLLFSLASFPPRFNRVPPFLPLSIYLFHESPLLFPSTRSSSTLAPPSSFLLLVSFQGTNYFFAVRLSKYTHTSSEPAPEHRRRDAAVAAAVAVVVDPREQSDETRASEEEEVHAREFRSENMRPRWILMNVSSIDGCWTRPPRCARSTRVRAKRRRAAACEPRYSVARISAIAQSWRGRETTDLPRGIIVLDTFRDEPKYTRREEERERQTERISKIRRDGGIKGENIGEKDRGRGREKERWLLSIVVVGRDTRERDVLDSRVRGSCVATESIPCGPTTRVAHQAVVFPVRINPGWVQCRYPLTRPVLPADGVFGERASREREREWKRVVRCWGDRCERSPRRKYVIGWWNVVIKTCDPLFVYVCVYVYMEQDSRIARSWLAPFDVSDFFVFAHNKPNFSRGSNADEINTGVLSDLIARLDPLRICVDIELEDWRRDVFLKKLHYTGTVAKSISAPYWYLNPVELSNVTVLTFLRLTFIKQ